MDLNNLSLSTQKISSECIKQLNDFFQTNPKQMVQEYCSAVDWRLLALGIVILILYIIEPKIRKYLEKKDYNSRWLDSNLIIFSYRWLVAGLMFILIYALWIRGV